MWNYVEYWTCELGRTLPRDGQYCIGKKHGESIYYRSWDNPLINVHQWFTIQPLRDVTYHIMFVLFTAHQLWKVLFSVVSVCSQERGVPCDHYLWSIGPHHTGPSVTPPPPPAHTFFTGCPLYKLFNFYSLEDPQPVLTSGGNTYDRMGKRVFMHPTGMLSCLSCFRCAPNLGETVLFSEKNGQILGWRPSLWKILNPPRFV